MTESRPTVNSFLFFGNTPVSAYHQRDHRIAMELAGRGFKVRYIEAMPSLAGAARRMLRRLFHPLAIEEAGNALPGPALLEILHPPMVPTFFNSSWTPAFDARLFRSWFRRTLGGTEWSSTAVVVSHPYWWHGFISRTDLPVPLMIYDKADDLHVPSRNETAYRRMVQAETRLLTEADHITTSAATLMPGLSDAHRRGPVHWIPNAVDAAMAAVGAEHSPRRASGSPVLGFVGAVDPRWIDGDLLCAVAAAFPECEVRIVGSVGPSFARKLRARPNVRLCGSCHGDSLVKEMAGMSIGLIPFLKNRITAHVNPLKLFEYAAFGLPIVATATEELSRYGGHAELAENPEEFVALIRTLLKEGSGKRSEGQRAFAAANTWAHRVDDLLELLRESTDIRCAS